MMALSSTNTHETMKISFLKTLFSGALAVTCIGSAMATTIDAGLTAGTLGFGPNVGMMIVPDKFGARLNLGYLRHNYNTTSHNVAYTGKIKLQNMGLFGDWHPSGGAFRFTGGMFYNDNQFALTGRPSDGTYTFNGVTYSSEQVGSVTASVSFNKVNPYVGFGWSSGGNSAGLHFTSDFGVIYQGHPKATITATGAAADPDLASNVRASQRKLQSDLNKFQWYPVLQFGVMYRF
jgi:hypothetical protein